MMNWFKKHDILLRVLSVIIALIAWCYVVYVENPDKTKDMNDILVIMDGVQSLTSNDLMITGGADPSINIEVSGKRDRINQLEADMITARTSVSHITTPGVYNLNYTVTIDDTSIITTNRDPRQIEISVERVVSKLVPIVFVQEGEPAENHTIESLKFGPDAITIQGAQSVVEQITQAIVVESLAGVTDSFEKSVTYTLADINGEPVDTELLKKIEPASVTMNVNMQMEYEVSLTVNFIPTEYLSVDMIDAPISPATITIMGPPEIIETINNIALDDVSLKYVIENNAFTMERVITIPNGVTTPEGTPVTATINISIPGYERRERTFDIDVLPDNENLRYVQSDFTIAFFGKTEELDLLEDSDFTFTVADLPEDVELGQRSLALSIEVKNREIEVLGNYLVVVNVINNGS